MISNRISTKPKNTSAAKSHSSAEHKKGETNNESNFFLASDRHRAKKGKERVEESSEINKNLIRQLDND